MLAKTMSQRGRNKIELEYSWDDTIGKTLALYKVVISNQRID